jgi:NADP-reducing hydrogenase subunit HndB
VAKLTVDDLKKIKERVLMEDQFRSGQKRAKITVHMGTCGIASGARDIMDALLDELAQNNVSDVLVTTSGCIGICSREPLVTVEEQDREPLVYECLTAGKMRQIFRQHIMGGKIQSEFVMARGREQDSRGGDR